MVVCLVLGFAFTSLEEIRVAKFKGLASFNGLAGFLFFFSFFNAHL